MYSSPAALFRRKVVDARNAGREVIDLTAGDLDFPTPPHIVEAAVSAARSGATRYTDVDGTPELKDAIRAHFIRQNSLAFDRSEIIVTNGSSQALASTFAVTLQAGGEVIIPDPCWQTYAGQAALAGGTPVGVTCSQNRGFKVAAADLEGAINGNTRWLVLNSPVNPTGAVYSRDELASLVNVLDRHPNVWVLADNLYELNVFDGRKAVTLLEAAPALRDRTVTIGGVAKGYSMTGWRIGWAAGPAKLIADMTRLQYLTTSCASSISQAAAVAALTGPQDIAIGYAETLQAKRDLLVRLVGGCEGLSAQPPEGTFYLCVSCAGVIGQSTPDGGIVRGGEEFAAYLLDATGVACLPGEAYAMPGYIRITFAMPAQILERAGKLMRDACAALHRGRSG